MGGARFYLLFVVSFFFSVVRAFAAGSILVAHSFVRSLLPLPLSQSRLPRFHFQRCPLLGALHSPPCNDSFSQARTLPLQFTSLLLVICFACSHRVPPLLAVCFSLSIGSPLLFVLSCLCSHPSCLSPIRSSLHLLGFFPPRPSSFLLVPPCHHWSAGRAVLFGSLLVGLAGQTRSSPLALHAGAHRLGLTRAVRCLLCLCVSCVTVSVQRPHRQHQER